MLPKANPQRSVLAVWLAVLMSMTTAVCAQQQPGAAAAPPSPIAVPGQRRFGAPAAGSADPACALPPETGPCRGSFPRFYWSAARGLCEPFVYGGCGGNANSFETEAACLARCGAAGEAAAALGVLRPAGVVGGSNASGGGVSNGVNERLSVATSPAPSGAAAPAPSTQQQPATSGGGGEKSAAASALVVVSAAVVAVAAAAMA